jgi:hypothetical protein
MNTKIALVLASSFLSLTIVSAMEMATGTGMMKDTMMNNEMKKNMMTTDTSMMNDHGDMKEGTKMMPEVMMYDKVMSTSKKEDISKLQMTLVEKGYLTMPRGVAYGHYGALTKTAYKKYKSGTLMKSESKMETTDHMMVKTMKMDATSSMMKDSHMMQ